MNKNKKTDPSSVRFGGYVLAGIKGGAGAGVLTAYLEVLFLLLTVGLFWVDLPFLIKALALYGLVGSACGAVCSIVFFIIFFRRHPLRTIRPWIFFFALLSTCGLMLEIVVYLLDIHTFRNLRGGWTAAAYGVLLLGMLAAGLVGWMIARINRRYFQGEKRRRLWNGAGTLLAFVAVMLLARIFVAWQEKTGPGQEAGKEAKRPANIIILLVDALRPDHLSAYGYPLPTSPTIDRLAREGVLFRHCYATSTWTVPTHASLFTGLFPSSHGAYSLYSPMDPAIPTLAQILAGKGFRTGSFFDNPLLGPRYGLSRGFHTALRVDNTHKVSLTLLRIWDRLRGQRSMSGNMLLVADKWIERAWSVDQPFFLFVNLMDVHLPYRPRKPYINEFLRSLPAENVNSELTRKFISDVTISKEKADALFTRLTAADWRWLARFYDSNIRAIDDQIGLFLKRLKSKGLMENTLVIITADHGETLGENGLGGHYRSAMHQAVLRIPLICWFPGRLPAGEIRQPVSQVDIFSTILRLAGFPEAIPRTTQSGDLFAPSPGREILAEFWNENSKRFNRAFYSGDFKLVVPAWGKQELYDLKNDHQEEKDLALLRPDILKSLASCLEDRLRTMPLRKTGVDERKKKEMEKLLRSLGYL